MCALHHFPFPLVVLGSAANDDDLEDTIHDFGDIVKFEA
jgi:hypothetical protein